MAILSSLYSTYSVHPCVAVLFRFAEHQGIARFHHDPKRYHSRQSSPSGTLCATVLVHYIFSHRLSRLDRVWRLGLGRSPRETMN